MNYNYLSSLIIFLIFILNGCVTLDPPVKYSAYPTNKAGGAEDYPSPQDSGQYYYQLWAEFEPYYSKYFPEKEKSNVVKRINDLFFDGSTSFMDSQGVGIVAIQKLDSDNTAIPILFFKSKKYDRSKNNKVSCITDYTPVHKLNNQSMTSIEEIIPIHILYKEESTLDLQQVKDIGEIIALSIPPEGAAVISVANSALPSEILYNATLSYKEDAKIFGKNNNTISTATYIPLKLIETTSDTNSTFGVVRIYTKFHSSRFFKGDPDFRDHTISNLNRINPIYYKKLKNTSATLKGCNSTKDFVSTLNTFITELDNPLELNDTDKAYLIYLVLKDNQAEYGTNYFYTWPKQLTDNTRPYLSILKNAGVPTNNIVDLKIRSLKKIEHKHSKKVQLIPQASAPYELNKLCYNIEDLLLTYGLSDKEIGSTLYNILKKNNTFNKNPDATYTDCYSPYIDNRVTPRNILQESWSKQKDKEKTEARRKARFGALNETLRKLIKKKEKTENIAQVFGTKVVFEGAPKQPDCMENHNGTFIADLKCTQKLIENWGQGTDYKCFSSSLQKEKEYYGQSLIRIQNIDAYAVDIGIDKIERQGQFRITKMKFRPINENDPWLKDLRNLKGTSNHCKILIDTILEDF